MSGERAGSHADAGTVVDQPSPPALGLTLFVVTR
jgi:hypothetical protein